jgi:hypothetical protein
METDKDEMKFKMENDNTPLSEYKAALNAKINNEMKLDRINKIHKILAWVGAIGEVPFFIAIIIAIIDLNGMLLLQTFLYLFGYMLAASFLLWFINRERPRLKLG